MSYRKITKILLIVMSLTLIIYDFFPFYTPVRGDTISEVVLYYSLRLFTIPFAFGTLSGHFFFPRNNTKPSPKVLLPVGFFVIILDTLTHVLSIEFLEKAQTYPFIWFLIGIPFGVIFWPQTKEDKL